MIFRIHEKKNEERKILQNLDGKMAGKWNDGPKFLVKKNIHETETSSKMGL